MLCILSMKHLDGAYRNHLPQASSTILRILVFHLEFVRWHRNRHASRFQTSCPRVKLPYRYYIAIIIDSISDQTLSITKTRTCPHL